MNSGFRIDDGLTPEFVLWSIDCACVLRRLLPDQTPRTVSRLLKPLAALDYCQRNDLELDGVCIDVRSIGSVELRGFVAQEVAAYYGGLSKCRELCTACPANCRSSSFEDFPAQANDPTPGLAGCYGWFRRDVAIVSAIDHWFDRQTVVPPEIVRQLSDTAPKWNGLWRRSIIPDGLLPPLLELLKSVAISVGTAARNATAEMSDLIRAVSSCASNSQSLAVELVPGGRTEGTIWNLGPYCPQCKAGMGDEDARCTCCGRVGHPHPVIRRKRIGYRPFLRLNRILDSERLVELERRVNSRTR